MLLLSIELGILTPPHYVGFIRDMKRGTDRSRQAAFVTGHEYHWQENER